MDNFKIIYKILTILEKSMDLEEFDSELLSAERLGISEPRRNRILEQLIHYGYVEGIEVYHTFDSTYPNVLPTRPVITLKGMEYLQENSIMKKVASAAKGIIDIVK